jgi:hypothetical protein
LFNAYVLDKFDKCELDCAWSLQSYEMKQIVKCQADCADQVLTCKDTPAAVACLSCTISCSALYDNSMRRCLSVIGRTMRTTKSLSECEQNAFDAMDRCMALCSSQT